MTILNFRPYYKGCQPFGGWGTIMQRRAAIFHQHVSGMAGHLTWSSHLVGFSVPISLRIRWQTQGNPGSKDTPVDIGDGWEIAGLPYQLD